MPTTPTEKTLPDAPRDEASPAAILGGDDLADTPGGGGLRGDAAAAGTPTAGGTGPNAPLDLGIVGAGEANAVTEAAGRAADEVPEDGIPSR